MKIVLHVESETIEGIREQLKVLSQQFGMAVISEPVAEQQSVEDPSAKIENEPTKEKKTRKSKVKEETPVEEKPPVVETKTVDPEELRQKTHEVLTALIAAKGIAAAREIFSKFNVGRLSELEESDFAGFVTECEAALG